MYQAFFCYALVSEWSKVDGCNPEQREFESHPVLKKNNDGAMAEWLGGGLQNLLHWFESS